MKAPLDHNVVRALMFIVLTAVGGVIVLALFTIAIDGGVIGTRGDVEFRGADEVVSVLGQIASAGVGALAGYFTARLIDEHKDDKEPPPPPPE